MLFGMFYNQKLFLFLKYLVFFFLLVAFNLSLVMGRLAD